MTHVSEAPGDEIARLQALIRQLDQAIAEFAHQGRRDRDGLERVGGRSRELESRMSRTEAGYALCVKDKKRATKRLKALLDDV